MNAQSGPIETYFASAGIPYKIVGGHRFFDRKEVKDIISYLSVVANPRDDLRLRRIINEPARKIGAATLDTAAGIAAGLGCGLMEVVAEAQNYPALGRALVPLKNFCDIYDDLVAAAEEQPLDELVSTVIDRSGYRQMLEAQGEEGRTRLENLGELVSSVKTYADEKGDEASLEGYLEMCIRDRGTAVRRRGHQRRDAGRVREDAQGGRRGCGMERGVRVHTAARGAESEREGAKAWRRMTSGSTSAPPRW